MHTTPATLGNFGACGGDEPPGLISPTAIGVDVRAIGPESRMMASGRFLLVEPSFEVGKRR